MKIPIQTTSDPTEHQKLMQEHMQTMLEDMQAMRTMGGPMMMGSDQGGGGAKGNHKQKARGDMTQRQEMMEKRMDMMQMMMEQMLQHDSAMVAAPAR